MMSIYRIFVYMLCCAVVRDTSYATADVLFTRPIYIAVNIYNKHYNKS